MKTIIKTIAAFTIIASLASCEKSRRYACEVTTVDKSANDTSYAQVVFTGKPKDLAAFKQEFIHDDASINSSIICVEY